MPLALQGADDVEFVFGKDLGESFRCFHCGSYFRLHHIFIGRIFEELFGGVDIGSQAQLAGDLLGDGHVVPGNHFDLNAVPVCLANRVGRVLAGWIEERQYA